MSSPGRARKPRRPWLAALLGLVGPLGHLYAGAPMRGLLVWGALQGLGFAMAMVIVEGSGAATMVVCLGVSVLGSLVLPVDAWRVARSRPADFVLRRYNRVPIYLAFAVTMLVAGALGSLARERWLARAFSIPSGAMLPTIAVGDHLMADTRRYRHDDPARGEIAIFEHPDQPGMLWVKRVVGLPGDQLSIRDGQLFRNGDPVDEPYIQLVDPVGRPERADQLPPVVLGPDEYYLLGDNRHRSKDSRFFGPVKRDAFVARARVIYWSWDRARSRVRWERIGATL